MKRDSLGMRSRKTIPVCCCPRRHNLQAGPETGFSLYRLLHEENCRFAEKISQLSVHCFWEIDGMEHSALAATSGKKGIKPGYGLPFLDYLFTGQETELFRWKACMLGILLFLSVKLKPTAGLLRVWLGRQYYPILARWSFPLIFLQSRLYRWQKKIPSLGAYGLLKNAMFFGNEMRRFLDMKKWHHSPVSIPVFLPLDAGDFFVDHHGRNILKLRYAVSYNRICFCRCRCRSCFPFIWVEQDRT